MVGPFVFVDQMGPEILAPGTGLDVAPHPHIGLATVTYMFQGSLLHRDSLGSVQLIQPGEINLMVAGRGVVHSERTPPEERDEDSPVLGVQVWLALRKEQEERAASFAHHPAADMPQGEWEGARVRQLLGEFAGLASRVENVSDALYSDIELSEGARVEIDGRHEERAVYVVSGRVRIAGEVERWRAGALLILHPRRNATIAAVDGEARLMLLGGAAMDGPRHIYWNFVSSSKDRIEQAKDDWMSGRFGRVPGETEWIPLPESGPAIVRYP